MSLLPWLASCIPHSGLLKCGNTWIVYPTPTSPPTEAAATAAPGALDSGFAAAARDILLLLLYATASSSKASGGLNTLPLPGRVLSSLTQCRKSTSETNYVSQVEQ